MKNFGDWLNQRIAPEQEPQVIPQVDQAPVEEQEKENPYSYHNFLASKQGPLDPNVEDVADYEETEE